MRLKIRENLKMRLKIRENLRAASLNTNFTGSLKKSAHFESFCLLIVKFAVFMHLKHVVSILVDNFSFANDAKMLKFIITKQHRD